ncbi:MAG TPA: methyltransferase domain-containing protein [Vicinamibacterales bacterium]|nr:methyltransferase domain-containing protein [Vicinamibacterales bacterium]
MLFERTKRIRRKNSAHEQLGEHRAIVIAGRANTQPYPNGKLAEAGLANVSCTQGNACEMPFPDHDFDVVVFVSVLGEIADRTLCLREVFRVLKPGGLLSIAELCRSGHQPGPERRT